MAAHQISHRHVMCHLNPVQGSVKQSNVPEGCSRNTWLSSLNFVGMKVLDVFCERIVEYVTPVDER